MIRPMTFAFALVAALSVLGRHGLAEDAPLHSGPWPIQNWHEQQPTDDELRARHLHDVSPDEAEEVDRLYDELMSRSKRILRDEPALVR
jgi:hypothetical protein